MTGLTLALYIVSAAESVASTTTDTSGDVVKPKIPSELSTRYSQEMTETEKTAVVEKHPTSTRDVVPETTTGMTPLNYDYIV